jgi:hypothetical protein
MYRDRFGGATPLIIDFGTIHSIVHVRGYLRTLLLGKIRKEYKEGKVVAKHVFRISTFGTISLV